MSKRQKTKYPGVFFRNAQRAGGGVERVYYIVFKKDGKTIEEKVGRQFQDDMTPARTAGIRAERVEGRRKSRKEKKKEAEKRRTQTLTVMWDNFYKAKQNNKSIRDDYYRWRKHLEGSFGKKRPADLVTLDVNRLKRGLIKKELAPATIKQVLILLKRIINYGTKCGICPPIDPSRLDFEIPKLNNLKTEDLTPAQLKILLKIIEQDNHPQAGPLMLMILYTGMRKGELFRLKWDHVDFNNGFILLKNPKGGIDQKIPLNDAARKLLRNHIRTDSPYVFPGRNGKKRVTIAVPVQKIKEKADLPKDFRPLHGLRHVYASMLASSGKVDMYQLQRLLTHKSPVMTQRYAHLRDEALKRASSVASDIISELDKVVGNE